MQSHVVFINVRAYTQLFGLRLHFYLEQPTLIRFIVVNFSTSARFTQLHLCIQVLPKNSCSVSQIVPIVYWTVTSLLSSYESATGPYPETDESISHPSTIFMKHPFIILPFCEKLPMFKMYVSMQYQCLSQSNDCKENKIHGQTVNVNCRAYVLIQVS